MSSTKWNSEIKQLFYETQIRYPHQQLEAETVKAYMQDWRDECDKVGFRRFEEGVQGARAYSEFFPMIAKIRKYIPEPRSNNAAFHREMADLRRRREAGEKFYTLAEVFAEFARQVIVGELKSANEQSQKRLEAWAKNLKADAKGFAARMLANSDRKRSKSDLESIGSIVEKLA